MKTVLTVMIAVNSSLPVKPAVVFLQFVAEHVILSGMIDNDY